MRDHSPCQLQDCSLLKPWEGSLWVLWSREPSKIVPRLLTYGNYEIIIVRYFKQQSVVICYVAIENKYSHYILGLTGTFLSPLHFPVLFPFSLANSLPYFISSSLLQNANMVLGWSHSSVTSQLHGLGQVTLSFWPSLSWSINRNTKKVVVKIKRDNVHKCITRFCGHFEQGKCTEAGESLGPNMRCEL